MAEQMSFGPYLVEVTKSDKNLFPRSGITRVDLVDCYRRIAQTMLPRMRDRPPMIWP